MHKLRKCFKFINWNILCFFIFINSITILGRFSEHQTYILDQQVQEMLQKFPWLTPPELEELSDDKQDTLNFSLPLYSTPLIYYLQLKQSNAESNIEAELIIDLKIHVSVNRVVLHAKDIIVKRVTFDGNDAFSIKYEKEKEMLILSIEYYFHPDTYVRLQIDYEISLSSWMPIGFYRVPYASGVGSYSITSWKPGAIRSVIPCFDEPKFKAKFFIQTDICNGCTTLIYSSHPVYEDYLSTYEVGFTIIREWYGNTIHSGVMIPSVNSNQYNYFTETIETLINYFHNKFNAIIPKWDDYDMRKMDYKLFFNPIMRSIGYSSMAFKEGETPASHKYFIVTKTARAVADYLFSEFLVPETWSDLWIKVGIINYLSVEALRAISAHEDYYMLSMLNFREALVNDGHGYKERNVSEFNETIRIVLDLNKAAEIYEEIDYSKATLIIQALDMFTSGRLSETLNELRNRSSVITVNTLLQAVQSKVRETIDSGINVNEFVNTLKDYSGFPVIHIHKINNEINFYQREFDYATERIVDSKFLIPVTFTSNKDLNFNSTSIHGFYNGSTYYSVSVLPENFTFVIFNLELTGYYRVNYDVNLWENLYHYLDNANNYLTIHPLNRAQIIEDAFHLARAGLLHYSYPLSIVKYLKYEKHYIPWQAAIKEFKFLACGIRESAKQWKLDVFTNYMVSIFKPILSVIWGSKFNTTIPYNSFLKQKVLHFYCGYLNLDCNNDMVNKFKTIVMQQEKPPINRQDDILYMYCVGLSDLSVNYLVSVFGLYAKEKDRFMKMSLAEVFTCSKTPVILVRFLEAEIFREQTVVSLEQLGNLIENIADKYPIVVFNIIEDYLGYMNFLYKTDKILHFLKIVAQRIFNDNNIESMQEFLRKKFPSHHLTKDINNILNANQIWFSSRMSIVLSAIPNAYVS